MSCKSVQCHTNLVLKCRTLMHISHYPIQFCPSVKSRAWNNGKSEANILIWYPQLLTDSMSYPVPNHMYPCKYSRSSTTPSTPTMVAEHPLKLPHTRVRQAHEGWTLIILQLHIRFCCLKIVYQLYSRDKFWSLRLILNRTWSLWGAHCTQQ